MTGRPNSYMPFYVGDYMRDTLRLTTMQHGAYLLLLCAYWADGCPLADDDDALAAITKLPPSEWKRMRPVLGKLPFFDIHDGHWFQKRCEEELAKANVAYEKRRAAGEKGNASAKRPAMRSTKRAQSEPQRDSWGPLNAPALRIAKRAQPEPEPHEIGSTKPISVVSQAAARDASAAPPAQPTPTWEQAWPNWASFKPKVHENVWLHFFANAHPNGSETILIVGSIFERDEIENRFGDQLEAHFGARVTVKLENEKGATK